MPARLVALDEGLDIPLDRTMVVVGRHPQCDARLDSLRVSRHHCCMTQDNGEVVVRDLGSTNGIRINGHRVEIGRLRPGDELSIAHVRYRLENGLAHEMTLADPASAQGFHHGDANGNGRSAPSGLPGRDPEAVDPPAPAFRASEADPAAAFGPDGEDDNPLAAAVRASLPAGLAGKCRIQVIVQMDSHQHIEPEVPSAWRPDSSP